MCNHSVGGVGFQSGIFVEPGADILIKANNTGVGIGGYRSRAVVIWCREISCPGPLKYAIGAEYYEPKPQYQNIFKFF